MVGGRDDALFGTGLDRPISRGVVGAVNEVAAPRFVVDEPSGLDADTGMAPDCRSRMTATFAHPGFGPSPRRARLAGKFYVVDIGVPVRWSRGKCRAEPSDLAQWVVPRPRVPAAARRRGHRRRRCCAARARGAMRAGQASRRSHVGRHRECNRGARCRGDDGPHDLFAHGRPRAEGQRHGRRRAPSSVRLPRRNPVVVDADALRPRAPGFAPQRAVLTPHPAK